MAVQYLPSPSQAPEQLDQAREPDGPMPVQAAEPDATRSGDLAERLARWAIAYLTALAAMLSLVGGAWALGVLCL